MKFIQTVFLVLVSLFSYGQQGSVSTSDTLMIRFIGDSKKDTVCVKSNAQVLLRKMITRQDNEDYPGDFILFVFGRQDSVIDVSIRNQHYRTIIRKGQQYLYIYLSNNGVRFEFSNKFWAAGRIILPRNAPEIRLLPG